MGDQKFYFQKNVDELANLLIQQKAVPDVLAITEIKLKPDELHTNINLEGYTFIHNDSEKHSGGVGFYIKKYFNYKILRDININIAIVEDMWIEVQKLPQIQLWKTIVEHSVVED